MPHSSFPCQKLWEQAFRACTVWDEGVIWARTHHLSGSPVYCRVSRDTLHVHKACGSQYTLRSICPSNKMENSLWTCYWEELEILICFPWNTHDWLPGRPWQVPCACFKSCSKADFLLLMERSVQKRAWTFPDVQGHQKVPAAVSCVQFPRKPLENCSC